MSDGDDPIDEYGPTHVLMEVPDLSGYNLPDLGLDSEPPPRPAAGAPPPQHAAQEPEPQQDTTRALNPEEAAAFFGLEASAAPQPQPAPGSPMGNAQPFAGYGHAPASHQAHPPGTSPAASPYGHLAQTTDLPVAPPSSPQQMYMSQGPGYAPPVAPQSQPGMRAPLMSIGAIDIPPEAPGMSDSTRLLLVFLGVGLIFALAFAAVAMLVGA